jgi:hypothetical protein
MDGQTRNTILLGAILLGIGAVIGVIVGNPEYRETAVAKISETLKRTKK